MRVQITFITHKSMPATQINSKGKIMHAYHMYVAQLRKHTHSRNAAAVTGNSFPTKAPTLGLFQPLKNFNNCELWTQFRLRPSRTWTKGHTPFTSCGTKVSHIFNGIRVGLYKRQNTNISYTNVTVFCSSTSSDYLVFGMWNGVNNIP